MKRLAMLCAVLLLGILIGCSFQETPAVSAMEAPTAPAQTEETVASPSEPETDVVTVPVTELTVTSEEEISDLDALAKMTSLRLLDLTALPYTPFSEIEAIALKLPDCEIVWNQMLTDGIFRSDATALTLPNATAEDVALLPAFSRLQSVDASGSTAYEALYAFASAHPGINVHYTLTLGNNTVDETAESVLVPSGTNAAEVTRALTAFPNVREADLRESGWTDAETEAFANTFPNMLVHRTVHIGDLSFDSDAQMLDLRSLTGISADRLIEALSAFPAVQTVALPEAWDEADAQKLQTAYPDVAVVGPVEAFGQTFDGGAEEIDLSKIKIDSVEDAEALIAKLPFLKKAVMCECGLTNEQMETLRDAHPDVKFVWTIVIGKRKLRTDAIGFSTKNPSKYTNPNSSAAYNESVRKAVRLNEGDIEALKYCTDLEALDLGHNYLTNNDLTVISGLTKLKVLILADNKITDISVLTTLKDLEYIELFMNRIPDLSPLTEMPSLVDVNVCNTGVSDLTPLFSLTGVKRLWYAMNPFSREQAAAVKEALPDCLCNYTTKDETAEGWREDPRYQWMRAYFN